MFAVVHSHNFPVVSVVAVAMNDVLADWLHQAEALAFGAAVIVLAIAFGTINVVGGFLVTDRMLEMFKTKPKSASDENDKAGKS